MNIHIKRVSKDFPLPEYQTIGAAGFDIYTRESAVIEPGETCLLPTNLIIKTPAGYMLMVVARSSLAKKKGLKLANAVGIIDEDYAGNTDEIHLLLHNFTAEKVSIESGERLAQGVFVPVLRASWNEVNEMEDPDRGGFGSTGQK